ncbi:MAG: DUF3108 domain-containing protein [Pseudomonadota bacterium]
MHVFIKPVALCGLASVLLSAVLPVEAATPTDHPAHKYAVKLPPSVNLTYLIKVKQHGIPISGSATVNWRLDDKKYSLTSETRAMLFGKIMESKSEGSITEFGLTPAQFSEKNFGKDQSTTRFNHDSKTISFSESAETYPIKGGEQDRSTATWQLSAAARGAPDKFVEGSSWTFFVAGRRDAEPWTFKVLNQETIQTPLGELMTVRISKAPPPDSTDQKLEIWLAPSMDWYPVRLRFSGEGDDYIEQTLQKSE